MHRGLLTITCPRDRVAGAALKGDSAGLVTSADERPNVKWVPVRSCPAYQTILLRAVTHSPIVHTENFIRRSINAMQHCYIQVVWLVRLSFGFLNVADLKAFVPDSIFARDNRKFCCEQLSQLWFVTNDLTPPSRVSSFSDPLI